jgi:hypothetical protein
MRCGCTSPSDAPTDATDVHEAPEEAAETGSCYGVAALLAM